MDLACLLSDVSKIDLSTFGGDEVSRMEALQALRRLVRRIERPWERMTDYVWQQPILRICLKTTIDPKLFTHLSNNPQTLGELAECTRSDPALLKRLLRVLVAGDVINEVENQTYVQNEFSAALKDPEGLVKGIDHYYDVGTQQTANLPQYLQTIGYRNPTGSGHLAFKYNMHLEDFQGDWWEWYRQNPEAYSNFNAFLSSLRVDQPPWTDAYPITRLLQDFDASKPLFVDVGGGLGRDGTHLVEALPQEFSNCRLFLQERPEIIESLRKAGTLPSQIQPVVHDFLASQPIKDARAYFLHSVLHDWPDAEAKQILTQIKNAMTSRYSKVLLFESLMPKRACDTSLIMAAMDINMMAHYAALERTEEQWRGLIEDVGLRYVGFYPSRGGNQGILEIELGVEDPSDHRFPTNIAAAGMMEEDFKDGPEDQKTLIGSSSAGYHDVATTTHQRKTGWTQPRIQVVAHADCGETSGLQRTETGPDRRGRYSWPGFPSLWSRLRQRVVV